MGANSDTIHNRPLISHFLHPWLHVGSAAYSHRNRGRVGHLDGVRDRQSDSGRVLEEGQEGHHQHWQVQDHRRGTLTGLQHKFSILTQHQCDHIGRFIELWATFKAFGNNSFVQISHILRQF